MPTQKHSQTGPIQPYVNTNEEEIDLKIDEINANCFENLKSQCDEDYEAEEHL